MQTIHEKIDAIREEFQDARPDVVMAIDELYQRYQRVSSDRLFYINLWEKVPVSERRAIQAQSEL